MVLKYRFAHPDNFPPHMEKIPDEHQTNVFKIFKFLPLLGTTATAAKWWKKLIDPSLDHFNLVNRCGTMQALENYNHRLHDDSRKPISTIFGKASMFYEQNIGHRDDWYTDAVFGQQQFTGTNPTTITLATPQWIEEFANAALHQHCTNVTSLLLEHENLFVQDCSYYRSVMRVPSYPEFTSEGRYGCASVVLFHLEPEGKLHPLAIVLDYKDSMEHSVTIFNRRISSAMTGDESADWPWRYAKMCAQVSDWFRHELAVHLVHTHFVEEVIIVAALRHFGPGHVLHTLLLPHWNTTLSLNALARSTLVPDVILKITAFTPTQVYAFVKNAYSTFDWKGSYVPNDLQARGFPIEDLGNHKYHNYGYARNIAHMWKILRKFVESPLKRVYTSNTKLAEDGSITAFCEEVRSQTGGQLTSFPNITTLDELIDFVTMCIHIASPQHTAVNYLQQYYLTFVPNRPSALYTQLPCSLQALQNVTEKDVLQALPITRPAEWLLMGQVPHLLSFQASDDKTILQYARLPKPTSCSRSIREVICKSAKELEHDLVAFVDIVRQYSRDLDDQKTPYDVLDPKKTAVSILI